MEKSAFTDEPLQNNREYYDTLLALFGEPVFKERYFTFDEAQAGLEKELHNVYKCLHLLEEYQEPAFFQYTGHGGGLI
jgi:hypothetical protein